MRSGRCPWPRPGRTGRRGQWRGGARGQGKRAWAGQFRTAPGCSPPGAIGGAATIAPMKILLALRPCSPGLAHRVAADEALAKALGAKANPAVGFLFPRFFDAAGPVLPRLLELADGEAVSFLRDVQCTPAELEGSSHFEALCRSTIGQSRADS